jgi:hypothetical protein
MNIFNNKIALTLICALTTVGFSLSAKTYTLANGKKIVDPYVISKRPDGLEIGHKTGISFVKFEIMPVKLQKKYGYSPDAAKKYEANKLKQKQTAAAKKQAEAKKKAEFDKEMNKRRLAGSIDRLNLDIVKTENRIKFLKTEIPRLQKECNNLLNKTTKMASTSVSGNGGGGVSRSDSYRDRYGWDGGFSIYSSNTAGSKAESTKRRTINKLEDGYSITSNKLKKYQKELADKEIEIIKMRSKLERYKSKK